MSADPTDPASLLTSHRVWPFSLLTNQDLSAPLFPGPVPSQLCPWGFPLPCEAWRAPQVTSDPAPPWPLLGGRDKLAKLLFSDSPSSRPPAAPESSSLCLSGSTCVCPMWIVCVWHVYISPPPPWGQGHPCVPAESQCPAQCLGHSSYWVTIC